MTVPEESYNISEFEWQNFIFIKVRGPHQKNDIQGTVNKGEDQ